MKGYIVEANGKGVALQTGISRAVPLASKELALVYIEAKARRFEE